jgi:hypothetical protein
VWYAFLLLLQVLSLRLLQHQSFDLQMLLLHCLLYRRQAGRHKAIYFSDSKPLLSGFFMVSS